jgi:hypothetical protein
MVPSIQSTRSAAPWTSLLSAMCTLPLYSIVNGTFANTKLCGNGTLTQTTIEHANYPSPLARTMLYTHAESDNVLVSDMSHHVCKHITETTRTESSNVANSDLPQYWTDLGVFGLAELVICDNGLNMKFRHSLEVPIVPQRQYQE